MTNKEIKAIEIANKEFKHDFQKFIYDCSVMTKYITYCKCRFSDFMEIFSKPYYTTLYLPNFRKFIYALAKLKMRELDECIDFEIALSSDVIDKVSIILHGKYKSQVDLWRSIYVNIDDDYLFNTIIYRFTEFFEDFYKEVDYCDCKDYWHYQYYIISPMMSDKPFENAIAKISIPEDEKEGGKMVEIKDVKFNGPATVVFWDDGTKSVVKCQGESFNKEKGLAMAICKKLHTGKGHYYDDFVKYCKEDK